MKDYKVLNDYDIIEKSRPLLSLDEVDDFELPQCILLDIYLSKINARDSDRTVVSFPVSDYENYKGIERVKINKLDEHLKKLIIPIKIQDINDPNTFIDIMTGVGGFCIYLVPTDQAAAPDNITGSYEFVYGGTTYRGDFSATKKYDPSYGFYYVVLGGLGANNNSSSSSGHNHHICEDGHKFSFLVLEAATTEKDGVGMWCCERCGIPDWNEHENAAPGEKVVISAYTVFNDTLENNIKAAESGATVSITTSRWVSVRRGVLEALAEKPGVTLTVNFEYQGMGYVIAIPGGDPALAGILASEDRFFGLMNLGNTYGLTAVEK